MQDDLRAPLHSRLVIIFLFLKVRASYVCASSTSHYEHIMPSIKRGAAGKPDCGSGVEVMGKG